MNAIESTSTRPYLIRALYDWCTDNGLTPYIAVLVDGTVQVPQDYVKNGEIVLNVSMDATSSLKLGNEYIEFKARFAGVARDIMVPINRVLAIYARENGQGMAFPVAVESAEGAPDAESTSTAKASLLSSVPAAGVDVSAGEGATDNDEPPRPPAGGPRPALKRVK